MWKKLFAIALSFSLIEALPKPAFASEILEQIEETGVIKAGYRLDTPPFAFVNEEGKSVGYAIDILELIRQGQTTRLVLTDQ